MKPSAKYHVVDGSLAPAVVWPPSAVAAPTRPEKYIGRSATMGREDVTAIETSLSRPTSWLTSTVERVSGRIRSMRDSLPVPLKK